MSMAIMAVASVGIIVSEMKRSLDFYTSVLACQKVSDITVTGDEFDRLYGLDHVRVRLVKLKLGDEIVELIEFLSPKGRPIPSDSQSHDRWFQHIAIVVRDMEQAYQHLRQHWVTQTSPNPQTLPEWNPVASGIESFYFKDIDGHNLELIHFPADKGDRKWQDSTELLFLGIDHTAIVVANTAASLAFYCDRLGMKLQQQSQNFGLEQERLSGISGVQVQISSLKAPTGLGIELLEYELPNHGRQIPVDTQANDLWCWQTMITIENAIAKQQLIIQDPDGHSIQLVKH
jgi:catechol 2,3-dioxygenase-like lactoylglutathione lyase family enzyme